MPCGLPSSPQRLKKGEALAAIATEKRWQLNPVPGVPRGAPVPDALANEAYFQVAPPAEGKSSPGKARTADGRWIVIECNDAQESGHAGIPPQRLWRAVLDHFMVS